jgi:ubiquinone/menaquinone biosynthesis C-methylase UbiE
MMSDQSMDLNSLKSKLKSTWKSGNYGLIAKALEPSAAEFLGRLGIEPGIKLLDVACGTGQGAIPAAKSGAQVTGMDLASEQVEQARERAREEGVSIQFDVGDAENMSYEDGSFDVVVSLIGAMFAPRPDLVTSEMARVVRRGGRLIMGNWTPDGFIGRNFKIIGKHVPPSADMPSPLKWGNPEMVKERLSIYFENICTTERLYPFRYPFPPAEVADYYITHFGPVIKAMERLDESGKASLREDLVQLWTGGNIAEDGTTHVDAELLEVVAIRK